MKKRISLSPKNRFAASPEPLDGGRVFRSGIYSTAILTAAVALAVLINLVVRAIPSKYTEFDLSEAGLYTLGTTSVELMRSMEQDVTVYYLCETGSEDAILTKLLDRYADESSHLRWEQKDPAVYPTFAAQYDAQTASSGSLILVCGERSTVLDAADLYEYDYSDYYYTGTYSVTFGGENKLTAAIYRLTSGEQSHAYYTINHGEQELTDSLQSALEAQNIAAEPLDMLSTTIPEDCDLLIINCPADDFMAAGSLVDEMSQLRAYLNEGGSLMLLTDAYYATPNLDALMEEFGLTRTKGLVVEGDMNYALYGYLYYLLPDYAYPQQSTALDGVDTSRHVLLQMAQGITVTETEDVFAESLLNTSSKAYSKVAGYEMTTVEWEEGDLDGPFSLAVYAQNENSGAEVLWIGCGNMDNEAVYQSVPGNKTFLQGCAASLTGQSSSILIESKALEAEPITVSSAVSSTLGLVLVILVPALVLVIGAAVVFLRRRR
ncbi:MAG: Gldg family protein [Faecalibacterium sp.]